MADAHEQDNEVPYSRCHRLQLVVLAQELHRLEDEVEPTRMRPDQLSLRPVSLAVATLAEVLQLEIAVEGDLCGVTMSGHCRAQPQKTLVQAGG